MNHTGSSHFLVMTFIMILSGLLSTMNVWADKLDDVRLSMNDLYMILLMTGWMLLFMGFYYGSPGWSFIGFVVVLACLYGIRTQMFVSERQFLLGMIPHHSMAVLMSKRMREKPNSISKLLNSILQSQENEIRYMKLRTKG